MPTAVDKCPLRLEDYDVSASRGFLAAFEPDQITLPDALAPIVEAGAALPKRLLSGAVRSWMERLPEVEMAPLLADMSDAQARMAMVRYSFLVQAYVWGEPAAPKSLPAPLAAPIVALADHLGQQPLLPYSAYVLDNWGRFDPEKPITLDNIHMLQHFAEGLDESWFVLIHVAIEARAGAALGLFPAIIDAANNGDADSCAKLLEEMAPVWADMNAIFDRMPDFCDPYVYFHRVRPYIHGWKDNPALGDGLIYEGVAAYDGKPQAFRGQTGSQSSIVPAMDALMGVAHKDDPLRRFLRELHIYRPPAHRRFIDSVADRSTLRQLALESGSPLLKDAYNEILNAVARFRTRHLEYAARYINMQNRSGAGNDTDVGTGGTPFMKYLKKHRDESQAQLLGDCLS